MKHLKSITVFTVILISSTIVFAQISTDKKERDRNFQPDEINRLADRFQKSLAENRIEMLNIMHRLDEENIPIEERTLVNRIIAVREKCTNLSKTGLEQIKNKITIEAIRDTLRELDRNEQLLGLLYRSLDKNRELRRLNELSKEFSGNKDLKKSVTQMEKLLNKMIKLENERMKLNDEFMKTEDDINRLRDHIKELEQENRPVPPDSQQNR
ncbi:MAG: hypothetical protein JW982_16145 [Spirochaetes bacterium]|nr:hypothetical protein [Spirochaetota bacterium]